MSVELYFDTDEEDHVALLPEGQRTSPDLERLAAEAESDVIGFYTRAVGQWCRDDLTWGWGTDFVDLGDQRGVYLRGYEIDAADAEDGFAHAMRVTIARVLLWRLLQETRDTSTSAEAKTGSTSRTYRAHSDAPFPRHWDRDLSPFDTRRPAWGI